MKSTRWGLGLLGVAGLLLSVTGDASAWLFHGCCGHHCNMHITCRAYNAFTPFCWGNVHCDGCCPGSGCAAVNYGGFGCGGCGMSGPVAMAAMGSFPVAGWGDPHSGMAMHMPPMIPPGVVPPGAVLPPGASIPTGLPMAPNAPPPGAPMPPGPSTPPAGTVPPILNHTAQSFAPGYYYGVQPASYPGYYANPYGYNPYAYWPAMAYPYAGYGQQQR
jgi:hypothetical protein